ncbi:conserved hypothetical protein [Alkaliphilus metalliredigens QYMF]|uniref:DZANK-type domain-containing protein n=1 Tax=Alkaliphilus metalliredigens (strain QYMF) TaxID=293826 RepID=A6TJV6_ALKMQ|nr:zinc ribbon domain-containing protein [Alkaliphilus metalliredigens]ABR46474.1 conserved hypothetical protein [Alkaliphilus metalliredigens QYMF]
MSNLQSKLGDGFSKLQGGLEQGKTRLQTVQEINKLKKMVEDTTEKKSKLLLDLGQLTHLWIREGKLQDSSFTEISNALTEVDQVIFTTFKKINELSANQEEENLCECGALITPNDKFCGECGLKLEEEATKEDIEMIHCSVCQEVIISSCNFCGCCGSKLTA